MAEVRPCSIEDCPKPKARKSRYCSMHQARIARHGDPNAVHKSYELRRNKGPLYQEGYVRVWVEGKRVFEHRWAMEQHLGRALLPGETVHHINGVRDDNRIENLELWVSYQPAGQRPSDLLAWAREIERRYGAK
jgi:hypothetical protein